MVNYKYLIFIILGCLMINTTSKKDLVKGSLAPEFSCLGDDGKLHKLSDYKGKKVVLYFYPKDDTPYCTQEAKGFRDHFETFKKNNIEILGISYDSVESHKAFKAKYNLPFTLLSDPESKVFKLYNAKGLIVNSRVSYIIDEAGKILYVFDSVSAKTHAEDVLKVLGIKFESKTDDSCKI